MNLRKQEVAAMILDKLELLNIVDEHVIIVRLPTGIPSRTTQMIGQSIVDALRGLGKQNPVLLLPYDIQIQTLDEKDMNELGWKKDDSLTTSNASDSRLPEHITSPKVTIPIDEQRRIWQREVTELLAKLQDTKPNTPGANTSGYLNPSLF